MGTLLPLSPPLSSCKTTINNFIRPRGGQGIQVWTLRTWSRAARPPSATCRPVACSLTTEPSTCSATRFSQTRRTERPSTQIANHGRRREELRQDAGGQFLLQYFGAAAPSSDGFTPRYRSSSVAFRCGERLEQGSPLISGDHKARHGADLLSS